MISHRPRTREAGTNDRAACAARGRRAPRFRRGFTLVELLIAVGIVILLLSLLIVALNRGVRAAQAANTSTLLGSIKQSLIQFKADVGYFPPVLDVNRNLMGPPDPASGSFLEDLQAWYSVTTLSDYLIGYGNAQMDDAAGLGIRNPGRDGVWLATFGGGGGLLTERNQLGGAGGQGQVLGPYLELKEERLIGRLSGGTVLFPGDNGYTPSGTQVICDYWGSPIHYYRTVYMPGALNQKYIAPSGTKAPSLWDVQLMQPFNLDTSVDGSRYSVQAGEFGLLSAGPDRMFNPEVFNDQPEEFNRDNIVEVGP